MSSKEKKEKKEVKQKSKEKEKEEKEEEEEEEEEEIEVEEEVKEEEDVEDEEKNDTEEPKISLEKTKDGLDISLELIKKFQEISPEESEESICDFINQKGLPMTVKDEKNLVLILYFHKLCVPFYKILSSINKKDILKTFSSSLKEGYYLFADKECKYFNYESIAKKVFTNLL